ncbi:UNVERIFIED_CONTAM: protein SEMI-ROLLED LEAF 2 [Sesamum calycinum]|uniref:Protein SEMI-ROLLED LEAF 2 n=1 Tax=Sesamum calycinum TaxID=2727403 RepID=A0AAW2R7C0_9LAMI
MTFLHELSSELMQEQYFLRCNEDQITQLLSALWIQVNLSDNLPANLEAIAHSFCLALISSRLKNSNDNLVLRFFQLPLSIRKMSLDSNTGSLPPVYQRSLLVLSTAMLAFAAKLYHIAETHNLHNLLLESDFEGDEIAKQLSEEFVPDEAFMFGPQSILDMDHIRKAAHSKETQSFDGEFSANSLVEDDALSISSVADISRFIPKVPASPSPSMSHIVSIGQLLESALEVAGQVAGSSISTSPLPYSTMTNQCEAFGTDTRKKLSNWLTSDNHSIQVNDMSPPPLPSTGGSSIDKVTCSEAALGAAPSSNPWLALRLPPASPFDNFLRAARG